MSLAGCLALSGALFAIGAYGLLTRRNIIAALMALELMVNAALINFVAFARYGAAIPWLAERDFARGTAPWNALAGPQFALFAMAITAAEMALALAIVVSLHHQGQGTDIRGLENLHG